MNLRINTSLDSSRSLTPSDPLSESLNSMTSPTNMGLMNIAGMTVPMVDTSQMIQQQVLHQQMIQMQQRAFLASSLQQNLEIQKQLLQQNQQLQHLLVQSSINSPNSAISNNQSNESLATTPTNLSYPMSPISPLLQIQPMPLLSPIVENSLSLSMTPSNSENMTNFDISSNSFKEISGNRSLIPPPPPPPPPPSTTIVPFSR